MSSHPNPQVSNFGFTSASLRPDLVGIMAEKLLELGSWDKTKVAILETNALQCSSTSSCLRLERELRQRLQTLTEMQLQLLSTTTSDGRTALSWLASVKRYKFFYSLATELLTAKLDLNDTVLRRSDYEFFVAEHAIENLEFQTLTETTQVKIRQVTMRMLREVGILLKGCELGLLIRPIVPPEVEDAIRADDPRWLSAFLIPQALI